jgi:N-acetylglucosaminyl-diphospho-decaprenol L-rhamnosyltransferase
VSELSVVIVSYNSRADLERSLPTVVGGGREVIVVDNASVDGTRDVVREHFQEVRLIELPENVGYGAACNEGIGVSRAPLILLLNPDAWPVENGIDHLVACASRQPTLGAVGPQLHDSHRRPQPTLIGLPSRWWTGRPAITSAPSSIGVRTMRPHFGKRFLVGAALLLRREAVEQVGLFDATFFMFYEEVDLCLRLQQAGWEVGICPEAKFVHIGGASTRNDWPRMYREQLRGHLRFLAKHHGMATAERARRYLVWTVRGRALAARGKTRRVYHEAARWLGSCPAALLLDDPGRTSSDRTVAPEERSSESER